MYQLMYYGPGGPRVVAQDSNINVLIGEASALAHAQGLELPNFVRPPSESVWGEADYPTFAWVIQEMEDTAERSADSPMEDIAGELYDMTEALKDARASKTRLHNAWKAINDQKAVNARLQQENHDLKQTLNRVARVLLRRIS